jgi:predicted ester cyclase
MSVEETQRVLGEYLDALLTGGDFGAFFADGVRWTTMETGEVITGRDAVRDFITAFHTQLFEASPEWGTLVCGDGSAALEATFIGKHIAEFAGVSATGAEVRLPYSVFYELEAGKITELRAYLPIMSLTEQLKVRSATLAK